MNKKSIIKNSLFALSLLVVVMVVIFSINDLKLIVEAFKRIQIEYIMNVSNCGKYGGLKKDVEGIIKEFANMNIDDEHEAAKKVVKVVGEEFDIPEKEAVNSKTSNKGEYSFGLQM